MLERLEYHNLAFINFRAAPAEQLTAILQNRTTAQTPPLYPSDRWRSVRRSDAGPLHPDEYRRNG